MITKAALLTYRDGTPACHGAKIIDLSCPDGQPPERIEVFPSRPYRSFNKRDMVSHVQRYDGMHIYLLDNEELRRRTCTSDTK